MCSPSRSGARYPVRRPGGSGPLLRFFGETMHTYPGISVGGRMDFTRYALVNRGLGEGLVVPVKSTLSGTCGRRDVDRRG